jgi:mono/diheme cytochrome c family protein
VITLPVGGEQTTEDAEKKKLTNPYLGQEKAIEEGEQIYRGRCIGCHLVQGGRGPNIFKTKLTDKQFLETVTRGRKGTNMPPFGKLLASDEIWKVHAFVMSRDHL